MHDSWWNLPGPGRFIASVVSDFRCGRNVFLRLPHHTATGIREAIEASVRSNDFWRWVSLDANEIPAGSVSELAIALHDRLGCQPPSGTLPGPVGLAASISEGDIICVHQLNAERSQTWIRFLKQFQHACSALEENRRGLFCVMSTGKLNEEPESDTALTVNFWRQSVSRLDIMLHLDRLIPEEPRTPILRQIALSVATELAGADADLGYRIASLGLRLLSDPLSVLSQRAKDVGWTAECIKNRRWHDGIIEQLDGEERLNSAALVVAGDFLSVWRRVWKGQVRVLYPFIEEQRIRLVKDVEQFLHFPLQTTYGVVQNAIDLEIGQIVYFVRGKRLPDRIWRRLLALQQMRNKLAHIRPVEFQDLLTPEFQQMDIIS